MRQKNVRRFLQLFSVVVLWFSVGDLKAQAARGAAPWRAAAAFSVITPSRPMWMAGYAARKRPSRGKVQDLFAKALVLEDREGNRVAICTLDLIGFSREFRGKVARQLQERYGIAPQNFLLSASHTHCGPELRTSKAALGQWSEKRLRQTLAYRAWLREKICETVGKALRNLEPVRLRYTHARAGFAMNRRLKTERGFIIAPNPDGPVDHDVPVLRVDTPEGNLKAVLFSYACHNTTLSFYKFCGDYAGYAQQYVQEAHPEAVALFMSGCAGDQNPYPRRKLRLAKQHGRSLANAVEAALLAPGREVRGPLRTVLKQFEIPFGPPPSKEELTEQLSSQNPYQRKRASVLLEELERKGRLAESYPYLVQAMQFGKDLTLLALAGEVVVEYSLALKTEFSGAPLWVVAYTNDVFGYVPTAKQLEEGGYEPIFSLVYYSTLPAPFAPSVEKRILSETTKLVRELRSGVRSHASSAEKSSGR